MKKLLNLAAVSLISVVMTTNAAAESDVFTVEKLNELNQLHDVTLSPKGDAIIYGLKKGSEPKDNHLYSQNIKTGKVAQLTSHEKSESNVVWADEF